MDLEQSCGQGQPGRAACTRQQLRDRRLFESGLEPGTGRRLLDQGRPQGIVTAQGREGQARQQIGCGKFADTGRFPSLESPMISATGTRATAKPCLSADAVQSLPE